MKRTIVLVTLALSLSLGGGAYAVSKIGAGDIKRNAVRSKHVKNGSIRLADLAKTTRQALRRGAPRGPAGPRGATGPRGPRGRRGLQGAAGGFSETLPAGKTARGVFAFEHAPSAAEETGDVAVSFPFALAGAPTPHIVAAGTSAPAECPGSAEDPRALPGHLCIYEADAAGMISARTVYDPAKAFAAGTAGRFGFGLRYTLGASADAAPRAHGTWAVTAP
jgi:hypothetical protein